MLGGLGFDIDLAFSVGSFAGQREAPIELRLRIRLQKAAAAAAARAAERPRTLQVDPNARPAAITTSATSNDNPHWN